MRESLADCQDLIIVTVNVTGEYDRRLVGGNRRSESQDVQRFSRHCNACVWSDLVTREAGDIFAF